MYKNAHTEKEKQNAALLLDHDMSTAYKQYNIVLKTEKAVSAAKYASTLMEIDVNHGKLTNTSTSIIILRIFFYFYKMTIINLSFHQTDSNSNEERQMTKPDKTVNQPEESVNPKIQRNEPEESVNPKI